MAQLLAEVDSPGANSSRKSTGWSSNSFNSMNIGDSPRAPNTAQAAEARTDAYTLKGARVEDKGVGVGGGGVSRKGERALPE